MVSASVVRFVHQKTGAQLYYIANDDINRVFDLTFRTESPDDTGIPHVFEHAVLCGSEKYPSAQLYSNLKFQTYNTYMNASTYHRYTSYPVSSMSEAQLLKLADFYTDSCFHPMVMEDESIFRTEAWRYRLNDPDDPLTIEGTAYSEMLGKRSVERSSYMNALKAMFPGTTVGNDHGGDPEYIPDLTWLRQVKQCTPEKLVEWAEMLKVLADEGAIRTAGSASAIKAEAERYDKILDPFGTYSIS